MKFSITIVALLAGVVAAAPHHQGRGGNRGGNQGGNAAAAGAGAATGTAATAATAQTANNNAAATGGNNDISGAIAQIQSNLDRDNPNGSPANGSEDDLNGDGVINLFEAGAQAA